VPAKRIGSRSSSQSGALDHALLGNRLPSQECRPTGTAVVLFFRTTRQSDGKRVENKIYRLGPTQAVNRPRSNDSIRDGIEPPTPAFSVSASKHHFNTAQQIGARIGGNPIDAATQPPTGTREPVLNLSDSRTDHRNPDFEDSSELDWRRRP